MKFTVMYLKYLTLTVLMLLAIVGMGLGGVSVVLGVFGFLAEIKLGHLIFVLIGAAFGLFGAVCVDFANILHKKWGL